MAEAAFSCSSPPSNLPVAPSTSFAKNGIATASIIGTIFKVVMTSLVICTERRPPDTPP